MCDIENYDVKEKINGMRKIFFFVSFKLTYGLFLF